MRQGLPSIMAMLFVAVAGCGDRVNPIPVSGQVTLDGVAVEECAVLFTPAGAGPAASGTTDSQGQFQLNTLNRPGAMPGQYRVTLTKQRMTGMAGSVPGPNGVRIEWIVPQKYNTPETSGLRRTVTPQEHEFVLELSSR
jgi:hypothetical protein